MIQQTLFFFGLLDCRNHPAQSCVLCWIEPWIPKCLTSVFYVERKKIKIPWKILSSLSNFVRYKQRENNRGYCATRMNINNITCILQETKTWHNHEVRFHEEHFLRKLRDVLYQRPIKSWYGLKSPYKMQFKTNKTIEVLIIAS